MNEIRVESEETKEIPVKKLPETKEELLEQLLQKRIGSRLNEIEKMNDNHNEMLDQWQKELDELRADGNHFEMCVRLKEEGRTHTVFRNSLLAKKGLTKIGSSHDFAKVSAFTLKNVPGQQLTELDTSLMSSITQISTSRTMNSLISNMGGSLVNTSLTTLVSQVGRASLPTKIGSTLSPRNIGATKQILEASKSIQTKGKEVASPRKGKTDPKPTQPQLKSVGITTPRSLMTSPRSLITSPRTNMTKSFIAVEGEDNTQELSRMSLPSQVGKQRQTTRHSTQTKTGSQKLESSKNSGKATTEIQKPSERKIPQRETKKPTIIGKATKSNDAPIEKSDQTNGTVGIEKSSSKISNDGQSTQSTITKETNTQDTLANGNTMAFSTEEMKQENRSKNQSARNSPKHSDKTESMSQQESKELEEKPQPPELVQNTLNGVQKDSDKPNESNHIENQSVEKNLSDLQNTVEQQNTTDSTEK